MKEWVEKYTTLKTANLIATAISYATKLYYC